MVKPTNILVPIDFSPTSEGVLSYAGLLATAFDAKLHVLHVLIPPDVHWFAPDVAATPRLYEQMGETARERLAELVQNEARVAGVQAETATPIGVPFSEILRYAEANDINLIVMGSHGLTSLREKIMVGSVAEKVMRRAHCPVVIVRRPPDET